MGFNWGDFVLLLEAVHEQLIKWGDVRGNFCLGRYCPGLVCVLVVLFYCRGLTQ